MKTTFPTLFVSHGSPMWAVEPGPIAPALHQLVSPWPKPRAIVVISAHWMRRTPQLSTAQPPETVYDFYGFPSVLYTLQYPAKGPDDETVQLIMDCVQPTILHSLANNPQRGLDHGAWVPLRHMYPDADVPVAEISMYPSMLPAEQYQFGQALNQLRHQGILVIGSGSLTHNLHEMQPDGAPVPAYVQEFRSWVSEHLAQGDLESMLHYRELSPAGARAHPTPDHLMPLFVAMGAGSDALSEVKYIEGQTTNGVINMDAYMFGAAPVVQ